MNENKRWIIDGHVLEDRVTGKFYQSRDQFVVNALNIIYTEIQELKTTEEQFEEDKNCHNCKNCNSYDEGEYGFDFLCEQDCMNNDGYFDYEYHGFKKPCVCPFWEKDEYDS